jgi:regulator of RNase E activity RraA
VTDGFLRETDVGLVLRWAVIERGTAGLADMLGGSVVVRKLPTLFLPDSAVVCGPVVLLRRERGEPGERPSSYAIVRTAVTPGSVVLIHADPTIGAAFGSGIALQAAHLGAAAMLTDGAWRDAPRLRSLGLPVGANAADPTRPVGSPVVVSEGETLFETRWTTGDWLLRDADGIIRLAPEAARACAVSIAAEPAGDLASLLGRP